MLDMEEAECSIHTCRSLYTGGCGMIMGHSNQPFKLHFILCHNEKGNLSKLIIVLLNKKHFLIGFSGTNWIMVMKGSSNMTNEILFS
jgi:hypothetical protein